MSCLIDVSNRQSALDIDPPRIQKAIETVLSGEGVSQAVVNVAVVDNREIHSVNRRYLQHDFATDVISFPLGEELGPLEGDVMVSAEMARQMAPRYGWEAHDELLLYVIHGVLHLVGYDDLRKEDRAVMRKREARYLTALGLHVMHRGNAEAAADTATHTTPLAGGEPT